MKTLIIYSIALFWSTITFGQNVDLQKINSNNVLDLLENNLSKTDFKSSSTVIQYGHINDVTLIDKSSSSEIAITQLGDYNNTLLINPENKKSDTNIQIQGSNNYIDITGANSISNGMKINLKTNDKMIFVRNY